MTYSRNMSETNNKFFEINNCHLSDEFSKKFSLTIEGGNSDSKPFPCFELSNFISDRAKLGGIRTELNKVKWARKENDLYSLEQTDDLANLKHSDFPLLATFLQFMQGEVREWLIRLSKMELDAKVALTGSRYSACDHLLPHDDRLERRAFAFAFYLTPGWKDSNGGELCLFDMDKESGHAGKIVRRIQPLENTLSLFPVRQDSWHSVGEVVSGDYLEVSKQRLSLNGWFFCDSLPTYPNPKPEAINTKMLTFSSEIEYDELLKWISPSMKPRETRKIRTLFEDNSEVTIENFLSPMHFKKLVSQLESSTFTAVGPPNKRHINRLDIENLHSQSYMDQFINVIRSRAFSQLISDYTGLDVCPLKRQKSSSPAPPAKVPRLSSDIEPKTEGFKSESESTQETKGKQEECNEDLVRLAISVEYWDHGCYSMVDDQMASDSSKRDGHTLELCIFLGPDSWSEECGGFTVYIEPGEEDELTRVIPKSNVISMILIEPEILSFTKYVNHRVTPLPHADGHHIYAIRCSYYGIKLEDNNSEEGEVEVDHFLDTDDDDEEVEAFDDEPDENEKGSGNAS